MAFCTNCGAQAKEGAKFCPRCGQAQSPARQAPPPAPVQMPVAARPKPEAFAAVKPLYVVIGAVGLGVVALALILILTKGFGLFGKPVAPESPTATEASGAAEEKSEVNTYEIFGDGNLIKQPQRLKASASGEDGLSTAALIGPWESTRDSMNTEYGFADDGFFYKNVIITHTHMSSIYHSGYWEYGSVYDTYHYGWWENNFSYTYTYLDTLIGEYRVKGGVIEFDHVVAVNHTSFEDDWYSAKTRSVSIEQLQREAKTAKMQDDFWVEFEFINATRIRFRDKSADIDLFWDIEDDPHNLPIPRHQIPAVEWPRKALSPDMPDFGTKGRIREASMSYSGKVENQKPEFKTVTVVIDKADALSEINAYGSSLRKNGWWVEEYELDSDDTYLSYDARKGMFKLEVDNGRGSGTSADTIVIESTKHPVGKWPDAWQKAGLAPPDNAVIVGDIEADASDDKNIYETVIFDKVDDVGAGAYKEKLIRAGFKKPQYTSDEWKLMQYIRISGDLYLVMVSLDERMDSLSSFTYDLAYVPDGVWPDAWKKAGLPVPEGIDTIAGAIDAEDWAKNLADYASDTQSIKFLGMDSGKMSAYFAKLKASGFTQVRDEYSEDIRLYAYLRIDGKMMRVEVSPLDNEDIAELRYSFEYYADGVWPENWKAGGLPAPDGFDTIMGAINTEEWAKSITDYSSESVSIEYLGLDDAETSAYLSKLNSAGFTQIDDEWDDTVRLYNYVRIDGKLLRVEISPRENDELTEFSYRFEYFEDGVWPGGWSAGGLPAPDGIDTIVGAIDAQEWAKNLADYGSDDERVEFLGLSDAEAEAYLNKLKSAGFKQIDDEWDDTVKLYNYISIDGKMLRVEISPRENDELTEFAYSFDLFEDGEWPSEWSSAGVPSPSFTAMLGRIDMQEFNQYMKDYGSASYYIKLLGANLAGFQTALKAAGYEAPEYSWRETWELKKRVQLNGKWATVLIYEVDNPEIPEICVEFAYE